MITNIHIENFKSIQSLDLELGRLNIFIGANGSGKSNILEAIAMGSAAMEDKLDDEFLVNRGVRVTDPRLMKSGYTATNEKTPIIIAFSDGEFISELNIFETNEQYGKWNISGRIEKAEGRFFQLRKTIENVRNKSNSIDNIQDILEKEANDLILKKNHKSKKIQDKEILLILNKLEKLKSDIEQVKSEISDAEFLFGQAKSNLTKAEDLSNFFIYAPENHFLRRFEEESAIKPLGIKGEGLFKLFSIIEKEYPEQFNEILQHLELIDWFESVEIPKDLQFTERRIRIKDRYLAEGLQYFDQRSANEGFLYLLFYLTLFVSDLTPHFFAIDNIDNSLNPKLGSELIKVLAQLAKKHNKQALLTTHNPVILDGLDLEDDDQRLFVVYRNADGHTKVRRVPPLKQVNGVAQVRLSEAFIRGYIGGLPDNF